MATADDPDLFRRALSRVGDIVMVLDRSFRLVYLNQAGEQVLGVPGLEVLRGRDVRDIYPDIRGTDREAAALRVLAGGGAETVRGYRELLGGWIEMRIHPNPPCSLNTVPHLPRPVEGERPRRLEAPILESVTAGTHGVESH